MRPLQITLSLILILFFAAAASAKIVFSAYQYITRNVNGGATEKLDIPKGWVARSVAWMDGQKSVLFSAFVDFEHKDEWNRNSLGATL